MRARILATTIVVLALALTAISAPVFAGGSSGGQTTPAQPVTVQVKAKNQIVKLQEGALGATLWNPMPRAGDPEVPGLMRKAGLGSIIYDSGPGVDLYDYRTNSLKPDPQEGHPQHGGGGGIGFQGPWSEQLIPAVSFDRFGQIARQSGTEPMAFVNYGTGSPEEAAGFVRYAKRKGLDVKYWEIGQNMWANGGPFEGLSVSPDAHTDKSSIGFATEALKFVHAMKAVDPTIKVGFTAVPMGFDFVPPLATWNDEVLSILAPHIDFIDSQIYPAVAARNRHPSDADLLALPQTQSTAAYFSGLRANVAKYTTRNVELIVGETNSTTDPGEQQIGMPNALFLADHMPSLWETGATRAMWFSFHVGLYQSTPFEEFGYGDFGLVSSGICNPADGFCQPPAHTPFPTYYAMGLVSRLSDPGSRLVQTVSSDGLVKVHAAVRKDRKVVVMLINDDPVNARDASLNIEGVKVGSRAKVESYGQGSAGPTTRTQEIKPNRPLRLAPYSISVATFEPNGLW